MGDEQKSLYEIHEQALSTLLSKIANGEGGAEELRDLAEAYSLVASARPPKPGSGGRVTVL